MTQILQYKVRDGLAVHRERVVDRFNGRATVKTRERQSFGSRVGGPELVDLLPDEVRLLEHAIEAPPIANGPDGKPLPESIERHEAAAEVLKRFHYVAPPQNEQPDFLAQVASAAVVATLKALGVVPAGKK